MNFHFCQNFVFYKGKSSPTVCATFTKISQKLLKENNHPICENSPNLVNLDVGIYCMGNSYHFLSFSCCKRWWWFLVQIFSRRFISSRRDWLLIHNWLIKRQSSFIDIQKLFLTNHSMTESKTFQHVWMLDENLTCVTKFVPFVRFVQSFEWKASWN
jgi:hypothetical protein